MSALIRLLAFAVLLLVMPTAFAQPAPQRYRVVDVAADDVLNVRAGPDSEARILGRLAPDATGIVIVDRRRNWARIRAGRLDGWVNARFLAPEQAAAEQPPEPKPVPPPAAPAFICNGTEPFWSLELNADGTAVLRVPDEPVLATRFTLRRAANNTGLFGYDLGPGGSRAFILAGENCSDGMSETVYPFAAIVEHGDRLLGGCCKPK